MDKEGMKEMPVNFEKAFDLVLDFEGGYSDHKEDKGGQTNWGITENTAKNYGYDGEIKELPKELAQEIYYNEYWQHFKLDEIKHEIVAIKCFDIAVNMWNEAVLFLQQAYNLLTQEDIAEDSQIGPQTIGAVNSYNSPEELIKVMTALQTEHYLNLVREDPSQAVFIEGWLNRANEMLDRLLS